MAGSQKWTFPSWQPTTNARWGTEFGYVDADIHDRGPSGAMNLGRRAHPKFREFTLGSLREDEAFGRIYEMYRQRGKSKDVAVIFDPAATTHLHRMICHGTLTGEPKITHRAKGRFSTTIRVEEFY